MIAFENIEITGWMPAIRGMRNPMNAWDKSDSWFPDLYHETIHNIIGDEMPMPDYLFGEQCDIGENDLALMKKLAMAGTDHSKFRRMIIVYMDITAPLYWWKEFDTYKVGTVANSCSTMHKIAEKEFTPDDFSCENLMFINEATDGKFEDVVVCDVDYGKNPVPHVRDNMCCTLVGTDTYFQPFSPMGILLEVIRMLNRARELYIKTKDKKYWWQMIQLLPSSYNQKRTVMVNYEVLANIYKSRKNHKLDEWVGFCKLLTTFPYSELITMEYKEEE